MIASAEHEIKKGGVCMRKVHRATGGYKGEREWLSQIRRENGISQDRLACELGIYQTTVSKVEKGYLTPSPELQKAWADFFGFDPKRFNEQA